MTSPAASGTGRRGRGAKVARVELARTLTEAIWHILTKGGGRRPARDAVVPRGAPTDAEITAAVYGRWTRPRGGGPSLAVEFSDAFGAALAAADGPWDADDFRPSEIDRFDGLLSAAGTAVRREAEAKLLDALIAALALFASKHPDAPRV